MILPTTFIINSHIVTY